MHKYKLPGLPLAVRLIISVNDALLLLLCYCRLVRLLLLPVVVCLVQLLLPSRFCLQGLATQFLVFHELAGNFIVLFYEAVVVIV
jgi:hypothetical protein